MIKKIQTVTIIKGIVRVHKQSWKNWPYPSPNIYIFVTPLSDNPKLQGTTYGKNTLPDNQI